MKIDIDQLKEWLKDSKVRNALIAVVVLILLLSITKVLFPDPQSSELRKRQASKEPVVTSLITKDIDELDKSRMESRFQSLISDVEDREKQLDSQKKKMEQDLEKQSVMLEQVQEQIRRFGEEVRILRKSVRGGGSGVIKIGEDGTSESDVKQVSPVNGDQASTSDVQRQRMAEVVPTGVEPIIRTKDDEDSIIRFLDDESITSMERDAAGFVVGEKIEPERLVDKGEDIPGVYVPMGSIISGMLLTGGDLPTSNTAKSQPFPMLYEVRGDIILPNGYSVSLDSCFMMTSGYGDISTGRGMIRSEAISCVNGNGEAVEARISAVAFDGEDGKVGVNGTLVSKHADLLGKTLMSSWLGGVGQAITPQRIPQISSDADGESLFVTPNFNDVALAGTLTGASDSIQKLSDFYISAAEKILPVVEIPNRIKIDFVVSSGFSLKI